MNLDEHYRAALEAQGFSADPAQQKAVAVLDRVREGLLADRRRSPLARLRSLFGSAQPGIRGAYLWGGVGRGKTFVMDLFFASLPFDDKLRQHFHRLMYHVHGQLRKLDDQQDPLATVAGDLARRARVICFDEFFVADIADAMILGRLFDHLFRHGVTLVATSNIPPDDLYHDGLQRARFLPAIDLIKRHTEVVEVDGPTDFRLRVLERAEIYHASLDAAANENLARYFADIAQASGTADASIEIHGRDIPFRRRADGICWFDFAALCAGPRSQDDYIEIARSFQTIILSDLPVLDAQLENEARRFIALVDEFYDRRVKLIISAAAPIESLYTGTRLVHEFKRTRSRLREMQTHDYLAAGHRP